MAPSNGLFCPSSGGCVAVSRGDTSPSTGTFYSSEPVEGGAVNGVPGVFCPATQTSVSGQAVSDATTHQILTSTYDGHGDGKNCNGDPIHSGIASVVLLETKSTTEFTGCTTHSAGVQKQTITCMPDGSYSMVIDDCRPGCADCAPSGAATVFAAEAGKAKTGACYELTWSPATGGSTQVNQKVSGGFDWCAVGAEAATGGMENSASGVTASLVAVAVAAVAMLV